MRHNTAKITIPVIGVIDIECNAENQTTLVGYINPESKYIPFHSVKEWLEYLLKYESSQTIYAHNGSGFDFQWLLSELAAISAKMNWCLQGGRLLFGTITEQSNHNSYTFADSALIFQMPLAKVGEGVKLQKLEGLAYDNERYNERDCRIVEKAVKQMLSVSQELGFQLKYTPAGCSFDYIRRNIPKKGVFIPSSEEFSKAYYGGMVMAIQTKVGPGITYDLNSLYLSAMCEQLPLDEPTIYKGPFSPSQARRMFQSCVGFAQCRVNLVYRPLPPLPIRINNRVLYPIGSFSGFWAFPDLASLYEEDKITIEYVVIFNKGKPWLEHIFRPLFDKRLAAKQAGEWTKEQGLKTIGNSGYGKTAEHEEKTALIDYRDSELLKNVPIMAEDGSIFFLSKEMKTIKPAFRSMALASYITSTSRRLYHVKFDPYQSRLAYLDTDCAVLNGLSKENSGIVSDKSFGGQKIEHDFSEFNAYAPKVYALREKTGEEFIRAKGIPLGNSWDYAENNGKICIVTGKKDEYQHDYPSSSLEFYRQITSGVPVRARRPVSFALAADKLQSPGSWVTMERTLRSGVNSNRVFDSVTGRTYPPILKNGQLVSQLAENFSEDEYEDEADDFS